MLGPGATDGGSKDAAKVRHMVRQCLVQVGGVGMVRGVGVVRGVGMVRVR